MGCRAPPGAEATNFSVGPPAGESEEAAVAWDAYWGFDCVAQRGLCDAMYSHLAIAQSSWQALKMLPAVSAQRTALIPTGLVVIALVSLQFNLGEGLCR